MNLYIWRAHAYARQSQALQNYRDSRMRAVRRGFVGTWDDKFFLDAWHDRIRWHAFRDLVAGVERSIAELERAEAAHAA